MGLARPLRVFAHILLFKGLLVEDVTPSESVASLTSVLERVNARTTVNTDARVRFESRVAFVSANDTFLTAKSSETR